MFGINEISWGIFIRLICMLTMGWYILVFILYWIKDKKQNQKHLFEDYRTDNPTREAIQTRTVSSNDFPSEIIHALSAKQMRLETSFYEETGLDEGFGIEHFLDENDPALSKNIAENQIHFQQ